MYVIRAGEPTDEPLYVTGRRRFTSDLRYARVYPRRCDASNSINALRPDRYGRKLTPVQVAITIVEEIE